MSCASEEARQQVGNQKELCLHSHKLYFYYIKLHRREIVVKGKNNY